MSEVIFKNLIIGAAFKGTLNFTGGRFILDQTSATIKQDTKESYKNVQGLAVEVSGTPTAINELNECLVGAYRFALDTITAVAVKYQTHAYFEKPIKCEFNHIRYVLDEDSFEKEENWEKTQVINGGDGFVENINFLDVKKNPRLLLHFYREAKDETNPIDYRILQLWRFFEGWFKKRDQSLVNELEKNNTYTENTYLLDGTLKINTYKLRKHYIKIFYNHYRCAVAHGGGGRNSYSKKIYYPRALQFYSDLWMKLFFLLKIADELLKNDTRIY